MMKRISFKGLDQELRRATYSVLLLMAFVCLSVVGFLFHSQSKKQAAQLREDFSQTISAQQTFMSQEIYMNQDEALALRLETVLSAWHKKHEDVQACVKLIFEPGRGRNRDVSKCSKSEEFDWSLPHGESIITAGNEPIARLHYAIASQPGWRDIFPPVLILGILLAFLTASLLHRALMLRLHKRVLQPLFDSMAQDERNAAIAETTQMIAHDIRKPFQKLKVALQSLRIANDTEMLQRASEKLLPGIEASMISVDSMLSELIESGTSSLAKEVISPSQLVKEALEEVFSHRNTNISLSYNFRHKEQIIIEKERLLRVLLNILENAVQAMDGSGRIWISTHSQVDCGQKAVVFCVGNNGPAIPKNDIDRIFESFFTRKKKGHGLGLAIAERIIASHGGRIWCDSSPEHGTEFFFTIPASEVLDVYYPSLPENSAKFVMELNILEQKQDITSDSNQEPAILVFDDDALVRDCWSDQAQKQKIEIHQFKSWEDFVARNSFDLIAKGTAFVDIQFLNSRYDGYHIASQLRKLGISRIYAITGKTKSEVRTGVFDEVLGKEVPASIKSLVA